MIVKMRFLNISGPRDDIDRVCEKYLSKYEMQIENAVTELKTTENIMPFVEVNPYRDPLAKAEQFAQLLPEDGEIRADLSGSKDDMLALIRDLNHDYLGLVEDRERLKLKKEELLGKENVLKPFSALKVDVHKALQYQYMQVRFGRISRKKDGLRVPCGCPQSECHISGGWKRQRFCLWLLHSGKCGYCESR